MCLATPSVTGWGHRKIEPITKHLFPLQENQSSWPNQTKVSEKKYEGYNNHAYKRSNKTQMIFMDRYDHELTIHRIPTNIPQKVITSNRSPRTLYWESKRDKKPSSYCLRTRRSMWITHASSEEHQWGWWTPPAECRNRALDWITWLGKLRWWKLWSLCSPGVFRILEYL